MSGTVLILGWRLPPPQVGQIATIVGPRGPAGVLYAETIGDGVLSSFTVTHALGTKDVAVNIYSTAGNQPDVIADIYRPTVDSIRIDFLTPPSLDQFRVVVIGVR